MLSVRIINSEITSEDNEVVGSGFDTPKQATEYIQDFFGSNETYEGDTLQLVMDGDVFAEYSEGDFDDA